MKIGIVRERAAGETRVAVTPDSTKKFLALGMEVVIETGAGVASYIPDDMFAEAGAKIVPTASDALAADIVLKVQGPTDDEVAQMKSGALLAGMLNPFSNAERVAAYAARGVDAFALELLPRITRAQSMDVLSSQSNLAGYRAVLEAAALYGRVMPQMMTAAGTVTPARAFVMGAGVAGLQAIATARRLGARVSATDVRLAAKEQVHSLGANFVMVEDEEAMQAETAGGYAKEMSAAYKAKQQELIAETVKQQDMVITTALIPGRPAPKLMTEAMVKSMKPGSVIVDMAVEQGGNVAFSKPNEVVIVDGVKIFGAANLAAKCPGDASSLYARNLVNFLTPLVDKETKALKIDYDDEIILATALTRNGKALKGA